jgi:hypothetical protein
MLTVRSEIGIYRRLSQRYIGIAQRFAQEPGVALGFVNPVVSVFLYRFVFLIGQILRSPLAFDNFAPKFFRFARWS